MDESTPSACALDPAPPPSPTVLLSRLPFSHSSTTGAAHAHFNGSNGNGNGHGFGVDPDLEIGAGGGFAAGGHGHGKPLLRRMASIKKEPYFANLRQQLQDQLRSFDSRVETQVLLTSELQDYFRRRAEVELEYSRGLDKLSKSLLQRQKEVKQKREHVNLFSISGCWSQLINETKKSSQEHGALADIYSGYVTSRFSFVIDDLQRVYRKCREIGGEAHDELLHVLHEFHTSTRTWHTCQAEAKAAEAKLRAAEAAHSKLLELIPPPKQAKSKKLRLAGKEVGKKEAKWSEARHRALKAKNEYLLGMDAANSAVQKYFVDDLSDLIDCMDLGFYQCVARVLGSYAATQQQLAASIGQGVEGLNKCVTNLDSRLDKQKFLELHNSAFIMPKKLEFQGPTLKGEEGPDTSEPGELSTAGYMKQELEQRLVQLHHRLNTLRTESDELWKTLETAESTLLEMLTLATDASAYDIRQCIAAAEDPPAGGGKSSGPESMQVLKWRADRHETDEFHLDKFHEYMLSTNRIARLQAKYDHIRRVLNEEEGVSVGGVTPQSGPSILVQGQGQTQTLQPLQPSPYSGSSAHSGSGHSVSASGSGFLMAAQPRRRKRIGARLQAHQKPKLFGGSLEEYIEATGQEIPTIMRSCIRIINLYGLHHQGLFRVSGSQVEINHFRDAFESGEDPLLEATDASDINSIAGVFKLYLRELREPLFPIVYFEQFMELAQLESKHALVLKMRALVASLPRTVFVVLRYLFAFLNHLSEFSDENMMDPYNIAICFGPTLVPVPEDKDQVQYQNLVNELIKNLIVFAEEIFPNDGSGVVYEKYLGSCASTSATASDEHDRAGRLGTAVDVDDEADTTSDVLLSDDESESSLLEAVAQYNFSARSPRELSFSKGDCIRIYSQVSSDWWRGSVNGVSGLVPDKYISIVNKKRVDGKNAGQGQCQPPRVAATISDSYLNVVSSAAPGGGSFGLGKEFLEPSSSSKSSPVFYSSETHPSSRSHHAHGGHAHTHVHTHQKSSSISSAGAATPFGGGSEDAGSGSGSVSSAETPVPASTSKTDKQLQLPSTTKEDIIDDKNEDAEGEEPDQEEASVSSSASRSHSLSISMPKSVENEATPPQPQVQPLANVGGLSGSQTLLAIREDEDDGDDHDEVVVSDQDKRLAQGSVPHPRAVQQHSATEAAYANMETYWEAMKQCKKPLPPQYTHTHSPGIRNGSLGSGSGSHPDLVMDLPLPGSSAPLPPPAAYASTSTSIPRSSSCGSSDGDGGSSSDDSSSNASSPTGSPSGALPSAAECFAKQNQCTLKKGARNPVGPSATAAASAGSGGRLPGTIHENPFMRQDAGPAPAPTKKPQVKVKPVLKSSFLADPAPNSASAAATAEFEAMLLARSASAKAQLGGGDGNKKTDGRQT